MQVSPLIDRLHCDAVYNSSFQSAVSDPFLYVANFSTGEGPEWDGVRAAFVDRQPHVRNRWYRYQLVYFDAAGEVEAERLSNWFFTGFP